MGGRTADQPYKPLGNRKDQCKNLGPSAVCLGLSEYLMLLSPDSGTVCNINFPQSPGGSRGIVKRWENKITGIDLIILFVLCLTSKVIWHTYWLTHFHHQHKSIHCRETLAICPPCFPLDGQNPLIKMESPPRRQQQWSLFLTSFLS